MTAPNPQNDPQEPQEPAVEPQEPPEAPEDTEEGQEGQEEETFSREYVEKLRKEAGDARVKAKRADDLAAALWTARVTATGRLADPSDLVMPEGADPLDAEAITAAVDELLGRKPHLASRRPRGEVGQGAAGSGASVDLAGILRSRA